MANTSQKQPFLQKEMCRERWTVSLRGHNFNSIVFLLLFTDLLWLSLVLTHQSNLSLKSYLKCRYNFTYRKTVNIICHDNTFSATCKINVCLTVFIGKENVSFYNTQAHHLQQISAKYLNFYHLNFHPLLFFGLARKLFRIANTNTEVKSQN